MAYSAYFKEVIKYYYCKLSPGGGGTPNMKGVGMLVVSLRGVDFGFWSHLPYLFD